MELAMVSEDWFKIYGKGTVAVGKIECDILKVGDKVDIVDGDVIHRDKTVIAVEKFNKICSELRKDELGGVLFREIDNKPNKGAKVYKSGLSDT